MAVNLCFRVSSRCPVVSFVPNAETRLCIWLVDDDLSCCEHLTQLLSAEPRVNCARSFSSASSLLATLGQESPPDAILLDVQMPVMNGIEAIRPIKSLAPSTAVLMLTTFLDHRLKEQSLAAGAADFLLKRNSPAQIVAAIRAASWSGPTMGVDRTAPTAPNRM